MIDEETVEALEIIWNYMVLNNEIKKSDLIIGCGCKNLQIPITCSEILKKNYAKNIIFSGGLGKITKEVFNEPEAEIYKKIALKNGVNENNIYIENKSTNTGDNFRFSLKIIKEKKLKFDKIIIVHNKLSERRTLNTAKAIIKNKEILITSPELTFEEFISNLKRRTKEDINSIISTIVGDIQRIIIYPQFGWQIENEVPNEVINTYYILKNKGFKKYIFSKEEIQNIINKYGLIKGVKPIYFN